MVMENVNCYNCGSNESVLYDIENGCQYVKCTSCGLVYLNPRPSLDEIDAAAQIGEHTGDRSINVTGNFNKKKIFRYNKVLYDFFKERELDRDGLKWFDIGCGFGEFLESLKSFSHKHLYLKGSEPNVYKRRSCQERELDVDFVDIDKYDMKYDFISLLNVYSHLPNPIDFIEKVKKLLTPGGELFMETGHSCHLPVKYHHKPYYAPDHLSFANKEIVEDILKKEGFSIIKTKIYRFEMFPHITNIKSFLKELIKTLIGKHGNLQKFFPKYPDRDMFVRARLIHSG